MHLLSQYVQEAKENSQANNTFSVIKCLNKEAIEPKVLILQAGSPVNVWLDYQMQMRKD